MQKPQAIVHETESLHGTGQIGYRWTDSLLDPVSSPPRLLQGPKLVDYWWVRVKKIRDEILQIPCSISPVLFFPAVLALLSSWKGQL